MLTKQQELQAKVDRMVARGYSFNFDQTDTLPYVCTVSITNKDSQVLFKKEGYNPKTLKKHLLREIERMEEPLLENKDIKEIK